MCNHLVGLDTLSTDISNCFPFSLNAWGTICLKEAVLKGIETEFRHEGRLVCNFIVLSVGIDAL